MIGKVLTGRGFRGALEYVAGRPGARRLGGNMEGANPRELAREFGAVRALRPTVKVAVRHIPLRLPPEERLSDAQWRRVVERVLAGLGYTHTPWVAYLHPQEGGGEHLHIVTSGVDTLGRAVDNSFDIRRLIELKGGIERDYGLRVVPAPYGKLAPGEQRVRRPRLGEVRAAAASGRPSERQELQRVLEATVRPGRSVSEVLGELERQGVTVTPRVLASGRVTGITYRRGEYEFSGTGLGSDFTWPGLLARRRLDFEPQRDLPTLIAAAAAAERAGRRRRPPDGTAREGGLAGASAASGAAVASGGGGEDAADGALEGGEGGGGEAAGVGGSGAGAPRTQRERTADQVRRQLGAIGCPRYDVMVLDAASGGQRHVRQGWAPEQVELAVPWLQHQNATGGEVLVRPAAPAGITLFEAVPPARLAAAGRDGYEPAAVVRGHDGLAEVWLVGNRDLPPAVQALMDTELGRVFASTRYPAQSGGYGHLAGFTSPMAQRRGGLARAPFVSLEVAPGRRYRRAAKLADECRQRAAQDDLERRAAREMAALGRGENEGVKRSPQATGLLALRADADRAAERLGLINPHQASGDEVEARMARWVAARAALAEARAATDAAVAEGRALTARQEGAVVEAHRDVELEREGLAQVLGVRDVPPDLTVEAARELTRWRGALEMAQETLAAELAPGSERRPQEVFGASVTMRTVAEELMEAIERQGLEPVSNLRAAAADGERRTSADLDWRHGQAAADPTAPVDGPAPAGRRGASNPAALKSDEHLMIAYDTAARLEAPTPAAAEVGAVVGGAEGDDGGRGAGAVRHDGRRQLEAEMALDVRETQLRSSWQEMVRAVERVSLSIDALEPKVVLEPTPERLATYDRLLVRLAELETTQLKLERRTLRLAVHRLGRDLGRLERELATAPSERLLRRYQEVLDGRWQITPRLGSGGRRGWADERGAKASGSQVPLAAQIEDMRSLARAAAANLLRAPSLATVRAYGRALEKQRGAEARGMGEAILQEMRGSRRELRAAVAGLGRAKEGGAPGTGRSEIAEVEGRRLRRALLRHQGAESCLAASLDDLEPPAYGLRSRLAQVRQRVLLGDLSPDTLSRLQRVLAHLTQTDDGPTGPPPRPEQPEASPRGEGGVGEAVAAWRESRAALRGAMRALSQEPGREELLALRRIVSRVQTTEAGVDRAAFARAAGRLPGREEGSTLPVRYFIDHPATVGRAYRGSAAWSAHAAERGVTPERIAQLLPRQRQSWLAAPRALSGQYALALAVGVARSLWQHYTHEP